MTTAPELPEHDETLWWLAVPPGLWAGHFLLSYATAAIWCAKIAGPLGTLAAARWLIIAYTVVALLAVALVARRAWPRYRRAASEVAHDDDSPVGRHRFLGYALVLVSG